LFSYITCEQIPEINNIGVDAVRQGTLVRFRCMVQDMYNPEFYVGAYKDETTLGRWKTTKYTEEVEPVLGRGSSREQKIWERRILYCVPIPGESVWLRRLDSKRDSVYPWKTCATSICAKRPRGENVVPCDEAEQKLGTCAHFATTLISESKLKSLHTRSIDTADVEQAKRSTDGETLKAVLNLPLGNVSDVNSIGQLPASTPCIVKMYGGDCKLKLNDVVELVGVLSIVPGLSSEPERADAEGAFTTKSSNNVVTFQPMMDFMEEERARNPPTSLVPRFHAIIFRSTSTHEFVSRAGLYPIAACEALCLMRKSELFARRAKVRAALIDHLSAPLGNDATAAEYVLYALLSRVHVRTDAIPIGKFSVTLLGVPVDNEPGNSGDGGMTVARALAAAIADIAPAVAYLQLTLGSLNSRQWVPKKDYGTDRLRSGPLQLASGTCLILDETRLSTGKLGDIGVRNVNALKEFIEMQEVEYDFEYHQMKLPVDVPTIVVSTVPTKSVVAETDSKVPLQMSVKPRVSPIVAPELLKEMREFVAAARLSNHTISRESSEYIEREMVAAQQREGNDKAKEKDLHRWLTMTRLTALSMGETDMNAEHWKKVLECERAVSKRTCRACDDC
jgi:hypothetical protein